MKTATLSKTATRLSNEELGFLLRRLNEIVRRIEEGTIDHSWVGEEIQRIIEGRRLPEVRYRDKVPLVEFIRPSAEKCAESKAPIEKRLAHSARRLCFHERTPEHVMAEMWEAECISEPWCNYGMTSVDTIMGEEEPTDRDIEVIASTLQWLATPIGSSFLIKYLQAVEHRI